MAVYYVQVNAWSRELFLKVNTNKIVFLLKQGNGDHVADYVEQKTIFMNMVEYLHDFMPVNDVTSGKNYFFKLPLLVIWLFTFHRSIVKL